MQRSHAVPGFMKQEWKNREKYNRVGIVKKLFYSILPIPTDHGRAITLIAVTANLGIDLWRSGRCISATPTPKVHTCGWTFTPENGQILENFQGPAPGGSGGGRPHLRQATAAVHFSIPTLLLRHSYLLRRYAYFCMAALGVQRRCRRTLAHAGARCERR